MYLFQDQCSSPQFLIYSLFHLILCYFSNCSVNKLPVLPRDLYIILFTSHILISKHSHNRLSFDSSLMVYEFLKDTLTERYFRKQTMHTSRKYHAILGPFLQIIFLVLWKKKIIKRTELALLQNKNRPPTF